MTDLSSSSPPSSSADPIAEAVRYLKGGGKAPDTSEVIDALLVVERTKRQAKQHYDYEQLVGQWRLGFVSGTRKIQPRPGASAVTTLGKGRFIPRFVRIAIAYEPLPPDESADDQGRVTNSVTCGPVKLRLEGPTQFWQRTNSLGFDFTALKVNLGSWSAYDGGLRGGAERNATFKEQTLKDQAFFTFFLVESDHVAARGRGGGLALWVRDDPS